jgi:hypothetical protein
MPRSNHDRCSLIKFERKVALSPFVLSPLDESLHQAIDTALGEVRTTATPQKVARSACSLCALVAFATTNTSVPLAAAEVARQLLAGSHQAQ